MCAYIRIQTPQDEAADKRVQYKEDIKRDLFQRFRAEQAKEGSIIEIRWLNTQYIPNLNQIKREVYEQAIQELAEDGLVEQVTNRGYPTVKITAKGIERIY